MNAPREEMRTDSDIARAIDRSEAYIAGLRAEIRRRTPIVAGPAATTIDRSTSQEEDAERWDGMG